MDTYPTLEQIAAVVRQTMQEVLAKAASRSPRSLPDIWATEAEALQLCGKSQKTLYRAIASGKLSAKDVRPNPIGKGYLIRRTALVKD